MLIDINKKVNVASDKPGKDFISHSDFAVDLPIFMASCTLSVVCSYTDRRSFPGKESNYAEVSLSLSSDHRKISLPGFSKIFPLSLHTHHPLMITAWNFRSLYWICIRYNYGIFKELLSVFQTLCLYYRLISFLSQHSVVIISIYTNTKILNI